LAGCFEIIGNDLASLKVKIVAISSETTSMRHAVYIMERANQSFSCNDWCSLIATHNGIKNHTNFDNDENIGSVSNQIFKKVGLNKKALIETVITGPSYGEKIIDIIPNFEPKHLPQDLSKHKICVRCDVVENWNFAFAMINMGYKIIVAAKTLPKKPIASFFKNSTINLICNKSTTQKEIDDCIGLGVKLNLMFYDGEDAPDIKRNLFDARSLQHIKNWGEDKVSFLQSLPPSTKLRTTRIVLSKEGTFMTVSHWRKNRKINEPEGSMLLDLASEKMFLTEADLLLYYKAL